MPLMKINLVLLGLMWLLMVVGVLLIVQTVRGMWVFERGGDEGRDGHGEGEEGDGDKSIRVSESLHCRERKQNRDCRRGFGSGCRGEDMIVLERRML